LVNHLLYLFGASFYEKASKKVYEEKIKLNRSMNDLKKKKINFNKVFEESNEITLNRNFGTACFGLFILRLVEMLRQQAENNARQRQNIGSLIAWLVIWCFMNMLKEYIEFLSYNAYAYAAIYGKGLISSGKMAFDSLKLKGEMGFTQKKITEVLLGMIGVYFCLLYTVISFLVFFFIHRNNYHGMIYDWRYHCALYSSLTILIVFNTLNQMINGASLCQLVLHFEDPERSFAANIYANKIEKILKNNKEKKIG